jgi:hypothetical protein
MAGYDRLIQVKMTRVAADPPGSGYITVQIFVFRGNPLKYTDPDGRTAEYEIDEANKTITIKVDIVIYGSGATDEVAQEYERNIMDKWGKDSSGDSWQMDINGEGYAVNFEVNVTVGEKPGSLKKLWNGLFGAKNYINADSDLSRSYVNFGGSTGSWRTKGRGSLPLSADNPAAHEFGHLLGLRDRYDDKTGIHPDWTDNLMGDSFRGNVEQRNIDALRGSIGNKKNGMIRSWSMRN